MIKCASPQMGEEEIAAVTEVLRSGQLCGGPKVAAFERAFAEWHGGGDPECYVAVSSGTAALQAALTCAEIGPGHEVIVPAHTFASTATAVLMVGARVVFADVNSRCQMDHDHAMSLITPFTRAVIPVHYFGDVCDVPMWPGYLSGREKGVGAFSERFEFLDPALRVIEDCAQAHGSGYDHGDNGGFEQVGCLRHFACWSFFATKHMTTGGEGGMVRCPDPETAETARRWRGHGLTNRWNHAFLGGNYRMTEMAAAIGLVQLKKVDELNRNRIRVSELLLAGTQDIPWLSAPAPRTNVTHTYFWCPVLVDEVELGMPTVQLIDHLRQRGVEVRHRYPVPLYRLPVFKARNNAQPQALPLSEHVAGKFIGLPNRPDMSDGEINFVLDVLREVKP
ncbi:MAG: DegT/DnrJ/EryC1/StrS family aminotransferase [Planctomycetota bacterium]|jgi:perosamine synthetase|nr:DegT/DnrJ/EryC1/StrS family aminotransferase [Planctomycetota bacterium]